MVPQLPKLCGSSNSSTVLPAEPERKTGIFTKSIKRENEVHLTSHSSFKTISKVLENHFENNVMDPGT